MPKNKYFYLSILWALAILAISAMPGTAVEPAGMIPFSSAIAHFGEFLVFGWLLSKTFRDAGSPLVVSVFYSALTEILQLHVPGRFFSYPDIALNIAGSVSSIGASSKLAQSHILLQFKFKLYEWFNDRNH